jgi:Na+(H+)/acetate symporter ActP
MNDYYSVRLWGQTLGGSALVRRFPNLERFIGLFFGTLLLFFITLFGIG